MFPDFSEALKQLTAVIWLWFNGVKSRSLSDIVYMVQYKNNLLHFAAASLLHFQYKHLYLLIVELKNYEVVIHQWVL